MTYYRPTNLTDVFDILADMDVRVLAGGSDIFPAETGRELGGDLLDITGVVQLRSIMPTSAGWRIGTTATWSDVANAPMPTAFRALQMAAREVGALQIQNSATVAGNLCNASPAADGVPPLLVLDAEVEIGSRHGLRRLPLSEFILGVRETALKSGEIITAIHVPKASETGTSSFQKLGARKYLVISVCMVAARVKVSDDVISKAAISVGSCSPVACRLPDLEKALIGPRLVEVESWQPILEQQVETLLAPIDDIRADAGYRAAAAIELIHRLIPDPATQAAA